MDSRAGFAFPAHFHMVPVTAISLPIAGWMIITSRRPGHGDMA